MIKGAGLSAASRATQRRMRQVDQSFAYGFCLAKTYGAIGHPGDVPGFSSFLGWDLIRDRALCVLTNLSNFADGGASASEIARDALSA